MLRLLGSIRFAVVFSARSYTDQAVNALLAARKHAAGQRRDVSPEHILFSVALLPRGVAPMVLQNLKLDLGREGKVVAALVDRERSVYAGCSSAG